VPRVLSRIALALTVGVTATLLAYAAPAAQAVDFVAVGHNPTTGTPVPGAYVTADLGTWSEAPESYEFQWLRDGVAVPGATAQDYLVQPGDVGHQLAPYVVGHRGSETAHFTGTPLTVRKIGATVSLNVRRVHPRPDKRRLVWAAIGTVALERPAATDGSAVTAYRKKDGHLKPLGTGVVTRGLAVVRLPWKRVPHGRAKVLLCYGGTDVVAGTCSPVDVVRRPSS
jgi:hypothetical protein